HAGNVLDRLRIPFLRLPQALAGDDLLGHRQVLPVAELLLVVFLDRIDAACARLPGVWAIELVGARDALAQLGGDLAGPALQRVGIGARAVREDDRNGAHRRTRLVDHRHLGLEARAARVGLALRLAAADHREVALVGRLADATDVRCDDRVAVARLGRARVQ